MRDAPFPEHSFPYFHRHQRQDSDAQSEKPMFRVKGDDIENRMDRRSEYNDGLQRSRKSGGSKERLVREQADLEEGPAVTAIIERMEELSHDENRERQRAGPVQAQVHAVETIYKRSERNQCQKRALSEQHEKSLFR